jgi:ABC-2 type transport system ATP-binding protein
VRSNILADMSHAVAIEVRGACKGFRIPAPRSQAGSRRRPRNPFNRRGRELDVLRDISFDVHRGEFFGIVGRNGSGKSTLLKLLASVYKADAGTIRIAGRLAPFLELGVGFNPQLPAYENIIMNGVMMGLPTDEARARYEEIMDFAGLREYPDLQVRNYSVGMKARLGFAIMTHVDADILLIDEVLAVGDAEFQEKCIGVFDRMHAEGRTIVLVTHSMATVNTYCERAMLLHDGGIDMLGDPAAVANRYSELNLQAFVGKGGDENGFAERYRAALATPLVRIVDAWLTDEDNRRIGEVNRGEPIELHADIEILRAIADPAFNFRIHDKMGSPLFVSDEVELAADEPPRPGDRFHVTATVENRLGGGHYVLIAYMSQRGPNDSAEPAGPSTAISFEVSGPDDGGMVSLEYAASFTRVARENEEVRA